MRSGTYSEGELMARRSLGVFFSTFLLLARDALVALLRDYEEDEQADALMHGELTKLDLVYCPIGDDGAEIIADFIKHDESVFKVWLWSCKIGSRGAKAIADALKDNETVEILNFFGNFTIDEEGAEALIDTLNQNVSIKELSSKHTNISPESKATIEYLTETRNRILIPAAVRRASLYLIAVRRSIAGAGVLSVFPKEIVKMIAMKVWATRKSSKWIQALSKSELTGRSNHCSIQ